MPVAKEAVFEYFSLVIELLATYEFDKSIHNVPRSLCNSMEKLYKTLLDIIKHPTLGLAWSPIIVHWTLDVLGDLSAKPNRTKNQLNEDLSTWMNSISGSKMADVTAECMTRLNENQTEDCIGCVINNNPYHNNFKHCVGTS